MVAESPDEFAAAVCAHRFGELVFESPTLARAGRSLAVAGLLVVGEAHGVRETPDVILALARALETRALAFEWSYEELDETVQELVQGGELDVERLWSLPPSAELFCGDGRITAGHFALLQRLREEGRLEQVVLFDRLDPEPRPADPSVRERELADRLLAEWDERLPLLVLTGAFHARLDADEGETMAMHVARQRQRPGLEPVLIEYGRGQGWFHGRYDVATTPWPAGIRLPVPVATPAVVPGRAHP